MKIMKNGGPKVLWLAINFGFNYFTKLFISQEKDHSYILDKFI